MLDLVDFTVLKDNSIAWGVYLAAAFVFLLAYWGLTRRWWFELRWMLFALIAVFLLVPVPIPGRNLLTPAMIVIALSPFTGGAELIASVIVRLILAAIVAVLLVVIASVVRRVRLRHRKSVSTNANSR